MDITNFFTPKEEDMLIDIVSVNPALYQLEDKGFKDSVMKTNIWREVALTLGKNEESCKKKWKSLRDYYIRKKREESQLPSPTSTRLLRKPDRFEKLRFLDSSVHRKQRTLSTFSNIAACCVTTEMNTLHEDHALQSVIDQQLDDKAAAQQRNAHFASAENSVSDSAGSAGTSFILNFGSNPPLHQSTKARSMRQSPKKKNATRKRLYAEYQESGNERTELMRDIVSSHNSSPATSTSNDLIENFFRGISTTVKTFPPHLQLEAKRMISNFVFDLEQQALSYQNM